jgi:hypothetical protein
MLLVTLFSIICSISIMAPGLGVVVGIISFCGMAGAARRSSAAEAKGVPLTQTEKMWAFASAAGFTLVVLAIIGLVLAVVVFVALFIMCSGFHGPGG